MAGSIGVVRQVVGEVFAVRLDGSRRLLTEGDPVYFGEQLVTGSNGAVAVALGNGQELVLGRDSSMTLDNTLLAGNPDPDRTADSAPAVPSQQDLTDVEKLQAAIQAGVDPTQTAEATAAGPGSGASAGNAGGGHSFVLLGETAGSVDPTIGFPTGPIGFIPEFPAPETAIPAEEEPVNGVPVAQRDSRNLAERETGLQGNVLENDDPGPDLPLQFVAWHIGDSSVSSLQVNSPYGVVSLNADGSYSFVLANGRPELERLSEGEIVELTFGYTIQDSNGDQSTTLLTITITITGNNDAPTVDVSYPQNEGGLAQVFERGLPGGSGDGDGSAVVNGNFQLADPDGLDDLKSLSVGGLTLDLTTSSFASLVGQSFAAAHGTVLITGFDAASGTYSFSYTLTEATTDAAGPETDGFLINVSDGLASASTTVSIEIVDDVPQANPDSGSLTEGAVPASLSGNVLGNDVGGADQPKVFTSWNGVTGATAGENGSLLVNTPYGLVTLNADGSYSFALANGSAAVEALDQGEQVSLQYAYSMREGDGDPSDAVLTISILGSNDAPTVEVSSPDTTGGLAQVFERGLPEGSSAGDGSIVVNGSFSLGDSDGLDTLKSLAVGSLSLDLSTSGFASLVGQSFAAAHGTVLITGYSNGTYSFSYTLTEATTEAAGPETDGFLINVSDGLANASATVSIEIVDDLPQAKADSASVGEGGSVSGNVVTVTGLGSVADVFGADGRPTPVTGVVGVRAGGDTSTPASGGVGVAITTAFGTFVLHADGSYSYTSHPDSLAQAGAVDTFTYSIVDADGDLSTTTLTIDIASFTVVGSVQAGSDEEVREAALGFGSEPASNDEIASGTLVGSGGNGPYSFSLSSGAGNGQYGQLVVNSNGSYSYTLTSAPKVNPGDNGNNLQFTETFTFQVTDANGNTGTGTLTVNIIDDVPDVSVRGLDGLDLQVDETTLGVIDSASFAGAFMSVFGADGAAPGNAITYSLGVKSPGVDSGLRDSATGNGILLFKEGTDIVGRVAGGGELAFRLSVAADGTLTLEQSRAIFHSPDSGPDQVTGLAAADLITLTATLTDGDGDKDSATLELGGAISFRDDAPCIDPHVTVCLDDDALPYGNPGGEGDSEPDTHNTSGIIPHDFGADGPGEIELQDSGAPQGFTYVEVYGGLLIKQGDVTVITITLDKSTGAYTVTQNAPILHAYGDDENNLTFEVEYKITDGDGDRANGSLYIKVNDDSPEVGSSLAQSGSLEVDETWLGQTASTGFAGFFSGSHGADGSGSSVYSLSVSSAGADSGLDDAETGGDILLYTLGDDVVGRVGGADGAIVFRVSVGQDGQVTLEQLRAILHVPDSGPNQATSLAAASLVRLNLTLTDRDGDSASASVGLGTAISFRDDAPTIYANEAVQLDDDALSGGNPGGTGDVAPDTGNLTGTLGHSFGADGAGSISLLDSGAPSGFSYERSGNDLLIKQGGVTVITLTLNPTTGAYSVSQNAAIRHAPGGDENDLSFTVGYQVTDQDGDSAQGSLTINVDDDTPTIIATSNLVYSNSSNPGGASGTFLYSIGADTRGSGPYSASDSDFTPISLSGTVGGTAISSQSVTWLSESTTSATFDISFRYAPNPANPGTLEEATGTLVFDKVNGTYSVSLDEPIQGFTVFKTSTSLSITGYEVNSTVPDNSQPVVSVVELDNDFFVQYTSAAEPGGGTGSDNLQAGTSNVTTFTNGELFTQAASWVSVSNSANGVGGDTLGQGEVLDLNFYTSNPKGSLGVEPSARASGMFLKFDGVNGEDLVVVLKLIGAGGVKTTRALVVSSSDVMTANSAALAAYGIVLDNNDGAIVIEGNDFNAPGENWQIYGAQILTSVEGITTSSAVDFNSAMGSSGTSDVSNGISFGASATDNDVLKVSDVGFITAESNTLDTELDFQVGIKDADGDASATQVLHVTMEAGSTFVGTTGNDVIQGTSGNDNLSGMGGDDLLMGGLGNDVLDGGAGIDTASYQGASAGVTVNLALLGGQNTLGAGTDSLSGIENLLGSDFNDNLTGNSGDNLLAGNGGSDRLTGGAGADTFKWLPGDSGVTTIADFTPGVDNLDLSQLLTGEHSTAGSLDDYLTMAFGANTTITVDSNSSATPGGTGQTIVLEGVNLQAAYSAPDAASVITQMLDDGSLKADV